MESYTKSIFPQETIAALVLAQFGSHIRIKEILPLTAGYFNTAYAVHFLNHQPDVVIRIAPHPEQPVLTYEKNLMRREVLILETVQEIEGIIDWERSLWGDPDIETAVACRFYGPAFFEGYGKQLADQGPEAARQSLYRLYLWLVLLIEAKVRYEDAEHLPWARQQFQKELDFISRLNNN